MADSTIAITSGTGTNVDTRTENTNSNHRQVMVIGDPSTNDGVAPVDVTTGLSVDVKQSVALDVSASTVPISAITLPLPVGGSTSTNQTTIIGHVDGIETLLGTIDADTSTIAGAVSGTEMQVDLASAIPAGTNTIGKLGTNSGVDIGDVDVTSLPSNTFVSEAGALGLGVLIQGDDGTDRKNVNVDPTTGDIQVDVTNTVTVDGSGVTQPVSGTFFQATQPVSGTVTANLSATDNAVLDAIALATEATQTAVEGTLTVTGGGGGTEYTEDVATANPQVGSATMIERDDALTTVTPVEGDWIGLRGSAEGALWTQDFNSDAIRAALEGTLTTDNSGVTQPISAAALPLPTGAALASNQQSDALTDTELRATAVPISGAVTVDTSLLATSAKQLPDGHNVTVDNASIAVTGTFFQATQPISGTVTETNSGTIAGDTTSIDGKITTCNTGAVVLAAGTAGIGKLTANSGVDIGDVDVASLANGALNGPAEPTIDSYTQTAINLTAAANQSLVVAPGVNKQIWVYGIGFVLSVAGTVSFQDEDDTSITGVMPFAGNSGLSHPATGNFSMPLWKVATNKAFEVDLVTADMDGWLSYAIVSV